MTTTFLHPTVQNPQLIYLSHLIAKIANWDSSWHFCFKYVLLRMILWLIWNFFSTCIVFYPISTFRSGFSLYRVVRCLPGSVTWDFCCFFTENSCLPLLKTSLMRTESKPKQLQARKARRCAETVGWYFSIQAALTKLPITFLSALSNRIIHICH